MSTLALAVFAVTSFPAQANQTFASSVYHPSDLLDGGCGDIYAEDIQSANAWIGFALPELGNGESIEIQGNPHNTGAYSVTFTCNNGNISSAPFQFTWYH